MKADWRMNELRAALLRTWGYRWMKNWALAGNVLLQPRKLIVSWTA